PRLDAVRKRDDPRPPSASERRRVAFLETRIRPRAGRMFATDNAHVPESRSSNRHERIESHPIEMTRNLDAIFGRKPWSDDGRCGRFGGNFGHYRHVADSFADLVVNPFEESEAIFVRAAKFVRSGVVERRE